MECVQEKGGVGGGLWTWHAKTKTLCDERYSVCLEPGMAIHPTSQASMAVISIVILISRPSMQMARMLEVPA